ncbi:MAG: SBBP repeat-containing protein, partial [Candidatus Hermodarchaeota archaeon]
MTPVCHFVDTAPITYQSLTRESALPGSFELFPPTTYGFSVPSYDPTKLLIIDPTISLTYSTYVSGSRNDLGFGITIDAVGNAYVTGYTSSTDFPTVNPYNATGDGSTSYTDVFVCKLAADGSSLLYSTYVSGSDDD